MKEECDCAVEELLKKSFSSRDFTCMKRIIENGRPTPNLSKMVTEAKGKVRRFNDSWYASDMWLCGCKKSSSLYCWPCLLFSAETNVWTTKGISDINSYYVLKKRHELSVDHVNCKIALQMFGNTRIEDESSCLDIKLNRERHNENVKANRYVISCLIDTVCFLAEQELPLMGHAQRSESSNRGNCVELLYHRASYDERLRYHLKYFNDFVENSHGIQNDLIDSISTVIMNAIKEEIKEAPFVSVIGDEATDATQKSQLSFILRYVTSESVEERFIRFTDVSRARSAASLSVHVSDLIDEFQCGRKLIALTYDGCTVMAGVHDGLSKLISDKYETVLFVHCYAHQLNLVLKQSVDCIKECNIFFKTLSGFAAFFSKSSKRKAAFDTLSNSRLSSVAPTRWIYTEGLVEVIKEVKTDLVVFLESIINNPEEWDGETRISSKGYYDTLQDFDFNFLLNLFSAVLPEAEILSNILQAKINDIRYCSKEVEDFKAFLTSKRENFDEFWSKCESECLSDKPYEMSAKRQRIAYINDNKKASYRRLYCEILDTMTRHLTSRVSEIHKLEFLALLDFDSFAANSKSFPKSAHESLIKSYGRYFDSQILKTELSAIYGSSEFRKTTILELYKYLITSGLNSTLPEVTKLCALFLTIPATSASVERSFSAMSRIHTHLRSIETEDRLAKLSLMSIEKIMLKDLRKNPKFHDLVLDVFAEKNHRIELIYKL